MKTNKGRLEQMSMLKPLMANPAEAKEAILFRCQFCGKEFKTVEECNACEANH